MEHVEGKVEKFQEQSTCEVCESNDCWVDMRELGFDYRVSKTKSVSLVAMVRVHACANCGEELLDETAEDAKLEAVSDYLGVLSPASIKKVRTSLGMSRQKFAEVSGIGSASLARWELGNGYPNSAMSRYIELLRSPQIMGMVANRLVITEGNFPKLRCLEPTPGLIELERQFEIAS